MVVSSPGFPTSVRTGTSCSNISDWVGFEGILIDVDRDPFYTDANKHLKKKKVICENRGAIVGSNTFWGGFAQSVT